MRYMPAGLAPPADGAADPEKERESPGPEFCLAEDPRLNHELNH